ncbi:MAG TPA: hypothetical protein ENJ98_02130 [Thiolapillus brandeum]|uniref:Uncharacterized protein n=1 Tax=Thiolapillus brandeum TaxID=1076588 RepID=A0A7C5IY53_9GAMM|nr:hypothetical protein [Thiolapillus brandeum]
MSTFVLDEVLMKVEAAPHSAAALVLYALVNTLEREQAGCLFKLTKLRDLDGEGRKLAYRLMELMAEGGNRGARWEAVKARLDELVRSG